MKNVIVGRMNDRVIVRYGGNNFICRPMDTRPVVYQCGKCTIGQVRPAIGSVCTQCNAKVFEVVILEYRQLHCTHKNHRTMAGPCPYCEPARPGTT